MGFEPKLKTPHRRQAQSWDEYIEEVRRVARPRRGAPANPLTPETSGPGGLTWPPPDEQRCSHVKKSDGKRCGCYRMKGARFCVMHGGARDNPAHPHTIKLYLSGALDNYEREQEAWREIRTDPARVAARDALLPHIKRPSAVLQREAMRALALDDKGKAWRRLIGEVKEGKRT